MQPPLYLIGLDLGQSADPSALAVLEQSWPSVEPKASYAGRELRRWPLGTPYPQIVTDVTDLVQMLPPGSSVLVIDGTGVGRAVVDLFRASAIAAAVVPVLITAGHAVSYDENGYFHVAKLQLVSVVQVLLGARRLKFAKSLPLTPTLERELSTFTAKITTAGNETFAADWRIGSHDDLVLGVALASWMGEMCAAWQLEADQEAAEEQMMRCYAQAARGGVVLRNLYL
jgi:hypothetical protein